MSASTLYDEVVSVTYDYLGPAADRFVIRQIRNHLRKKPEDLQRRDLKQLIDWIQIAMRLISNDTKVIDEYVANLENLAKTNQLVKHGKKVTH